jgi:hypothetical protein
MEHGVHSSQLETGGNLEFDCTEAPSIRRHEPLVLPLVWVVVGNRRRGSQKCVAHIQRFSWPNKRDCSTRSMVLCDEPAGRTSTQGGQGKTRTTLMRDAALPGAT